MKTELRYAAHPADVKSYDTEKLRKEFLIENVLFLMRLSLVYSMYDRFIVGGAMPLKESLRLEPFDDLKASYFLDRREMGIINIGGAAEIRADDVYSASDSKKPYILERRPGKWFSNP